MGAVPHVWSVSAERRGQRLPPGSCCGVAVAGRTLCWRRPRRARPSVAVGSTVVQPRGPQPVLRHGFAPAAVSGSVSVFSEPRDVSVHLLLWLVGVPLVGSSVLRLSAAH